MIQEKKPKIGDLRIGICKHNFKIVLQYFEGFDESDAEDDGWMCLHNEDEEIDKLEVLDYIKHNRSN